ncbi:threonine-phosphate decarboxylase [Salinigranum rubrum]|uniref:threonine-phosphate decarboxylase n=1 Tax=Salinigranum rubrum TaxID=755307 RepID=A0A2I8VPP9_9EURY|nr:threonine-phosphate decarboxylase CobD [Salinigranum rubrum]AUV83854.1 threonine-phosphate decarboxylase [Salinigranum rubrum]
MDPDSVSAVGRAVHGGSTHDLDFSANTNPERPPGVRTVYESAFESSTRYPDESYREYRTAAADYVGCRVEEVVPTAGGTEAIRLALATHVSPGDSVLVPTPSFGEYAREVRLQGATPEFVPHDQMVDSSPDGYAAAVVCTPNNPTGEVADPEALAAFAARCREEGTLLVVDEAFLDFTDADSLAGREGTVVCRSLTKLFGLPGLRMGFACATGDSYDRIETARPAWNLSTPAAAVGAHCLRQGAFVERTRERVARERERMREILAESGYEVFESDAPFLLLDVGSRSVEAVVEAMADEGIAVRDCRSFGLENHVRVAVKRREENDRLLEALARV